MTTRRTLGNLGTCLLLMAVTGQVRAQGLFDANASDATWEFAGPGESFFERATRERGAFTGSEGAETGEIETDRDSFTPATTTAAPGRFILESAYTFIDNRRTFDTHSFPEIVLRQGVTEWLEARIQWNYEVGGAGNTVSAEAGDEEFFDQGIERESQLGYGFKVKINEQKDWVPESAFLAIGFTPTSGVEDASSFVGTYVWGWTLPRRWKLDAAIRYSVDSIEGDGHNLWAPSIVMKAPLWERFNVHAEYFGIFTTGKANDSNAQYFSPGLHYLVNRDFEVGFRLGWGLNDDAANFFVNAGIGWRH
jgi:hypothetical protein